MKVAVCSDLHLEFGDLTLTNDENAHVLILSGDIFIVKELADVDHAYQKRYYNFIKLCCEQFPHVLLVTGNHEHYHGDFATTHNIIRNVFKDLNNLHFLDKEYVSIDDVIFYGGTMWTDMNKEDPITMMQMQSAMNDYYQIKNTSPNAGGKFLPQDSVADHFAFRTELDKILNLYPETQFVVVGHHAPSKNSTHPRYKTEYHMNGAYSTDMHEFILDRRQIRLWTHGHTHDEFDYMIGTTRIVCNPRGYDGYENRAFDFKLKYVEI